jgi:glycosyltransferase involved in cell wall biosynthesis
MKIIAYLNEPAKYTVALTEEVYKSRDVEFHYDLRNTQHNNKNFDFQFLREMPFYRRWKLYYANWKKSDLIISNGYLFDWFIVSFILNLLTFKWKPIAIESDTIYLKSESFKQYLGKMVKGFFFRFPFVYGFSAGSVLHRDFFTRNGMKNDRVFLMPWISINYNFIESKELSEPFIFTYVGRFVDFKNIPCIIDEFLFAFGKNDKIILKLVGDGPLFPELKERCSNNSNVIFTGKLFDEELENVFRRSHCLVLSSIPEMWGLVVNEALSAGMPVILSKFVGSRYDLVDGKDTGMIFDPLLKGDLARCMQEISSDPELYALYSKNAYSLMHEHWNFNFYRQCFEGATKEIFQRYGK